MEIIRTEYKEDALGRYEELLLRRDNLRKTAEQLQIRYIREFGDLMVRSFETRIECIRKKKIIAYCQRLVNRGEKIDGAKLDSYIAREMESYQAELRELIGQNAAVKESQGVSSYDLYRIKKLYHGLAKLIHPDLHPAFADDPVLTDFWGQIVLAYEHNLLEDLEELDFRVRKYLGDKGDRDLEIVVPDLAGKIGRVEAEIDRITSTDPYLYKLFLSDEEAVAGRKRELQEEIDAYTDYSRQLDDVISQFKIERYYS